MRTSVPGENSSRRRVDLRRPPPPAAGPPPARRRDLPTVDRGGSVLIPAFAVDRTELVLLEVGRLMREGLVPEVPVHVDSPWHWRHSRCNRRAAVRGGTQFHPEARELLAGFEAGHVHAVQDVAGSEQLNAPRVPSIVISASGMATVGRVVHHLAHQLPDRRNTVILTGYQAEGTRGRQLVEGARHVKIHGRYVPVRAEIVDVPDFSVHSDADETIGWLRRAPRAPRTVYVVHGEPAAARALADRISRELGWVAVVPSYGERVLVG